MQYLDGIPYLVVGLIIQFFVDIFLLVYLDRIIKVLKVKK